ncbi:zinc-binding alcohol dehydrogenase family protein [Mycolicibacterium sp. 018/SC-01/001]|uniref:quinone oxidoreductase family protein n=1 Tax=Mycolicibacterium sp. 018/SC-01/001 TaxID=2592069 RepID=UPI00117FAE11|nr:zinc-binding alcohol dehydrogenase family protein [Mycolicibacterium sp. 018/SC-01/001]TRW77540.1 zinc-binding alcohol dehydrogenase family protein [Mycolicibacterium sp. 018/SC-01/001]
MKAAVVTAFGQAPRYADFADPPADAMTGQVLAASVKNLDRGLVSGRHYGSAALQPPFVPGVDGVVALPDGRRVYSPSNGPHGMMAERATVDPSRMVELPDGLDPALGAAIPNPGLSAWFALEHAAQVQPGQCVLILGATGVTGRVATQLAKHRFGAGRVVVAGRNEESLTELLRASADDKVVLGDDLTAQVAARHADHPFDAVLDYLWGPVAEGVLAALGNSALTAEYHQTRYVQIGNMAGDPINLPAAVLRSAGVTLTGVGFGSVPAEAQARANTEFLPELFAMAAAGDLDIDVARRPLADVETVWTTSVPSRQRVVLIP